MEKKGAGHLEIIFSLIMFIAFVVFALYFFNPGDSTRLVESTLTYAFDSVVKNVTVELDTYSIKIDDSIKENIIDIPSPVTDINKKVFVENYSGKKLTARVVAGRLIVDRDQNKFFIVKYSEDFVSGPAPVGSARQLLANEYSISSSSSDNVLSENKIKLLNQSYSSDYLGLKKQFKLPSNSDFSFDFVFATNDKISSINSVPASSEVYSKNERREIIRTNGATTFVDVVIKVW